jgi:hypothetical protein
MGEAFIVRKGGAVTEQALAPTITEVSTTATSITFTITNNDASTAVILYEVDDATPDENSIELAAAATSSNITITGLTEDVEYDVYATANVTGKVKSNVTSIAITAVEPILYTAATGGTTLEYDDGGTRYKSHTFTSNGTFEVTTVGNAAGGGNQVDYLIIAGGGGGGNWQGGGGGAGGYRTTFGTQGGLGTLDSKVTVSVASYGVTIGLGGAGAKTFNSERGASGTASQVSFPSTIISSGGGGGGGSNTTGDTGGSGGAGGGRNAAGGAGTANQGFAGGTGFPGDLVAGGGGGGAGQAGANGSGNNGGKGGDGLSSIIRTGSTEARAGGGGGFIDTRAGGTGGAGGSGGGTAGSIFGINADANTGAGAGGGAAQSDGAGRGGGNGGSGIVIIRYEIAPSV